MRSIVHLAKLRSPDCSSSRSRWPTAARMSGRRRSFAKTSSARVASEQRPLTKNANLKRPFTKCGYCRYAAKHSTLGRWKLATERGHAFSVIKDGQTVRGRLIRSTQFASGRFVMIDDGLGFSLVPWRPVIEKEMAGR
jgi:hypothetical protein